MKVCFNRVQEGDNVVLSHSNMSDELLKLIAKYKDTVKDFDRINEKLDPLLRAKEIVGEKMSSIKHYAFVLASEENEKACGEGQLEMKIDDDSKICFTLTESGSSGGFSDFMKNILGGGR